MAFYLLRPTRKIPDLLIIIGCLLVLPASFLLVRCQVWRSHPDWYWHVQMSKNVNRRMNGGITPLIDAAMFNETSKVKWLIERGADVNLKDFRGETALIWAANIGDQATDLVTYLIEHGADVNTKSPYVGSALDVARAKGDNCKQIIELLERAAAKGKGGSQEASGSKGSSKGLIP